MAQMRAIAEECFALVREYKGSHSGEHGDGIVRSEFNEPMFGPRIARAFETGEGRLRSDGHLLNPGRIVRPPRMDDRTLFRYRPDYQADAARHAGARLVGLARAAGRAACSARSRCATTTAPAGNSTPA